MGTRSIAAIWAALAGGAAATADAIPAGLPRYHLAARIDPAAHLVSVRERVTWTNRHERPTARLAFNVYPRFRLPDADYGKIAKTVELLRQNPRRAIDSQGYRGSVGRATLIGREPVPLKFSWGAANMCALYVDLPEPVGPGESVTVELEYRLSLPPKQGRWGQWPTDPDTGAATPDTVTTLSHWLPTLAYYDGAGWHPTPFIPWHQPFYNEAGVWTAELTLPADQELACTASPLREVPAGPGWKRVDTRPVVARDFAALCSARYRVFERRVTLAGSPRPVTVRCLAYPEHGFYANQILRITAEALQAYSRWFGPYPYDQFTTAMSYFAWLGNECSGLIMIDERIFKMPHLAVGYVEYLVSHETCHQWWYNRVGSNGYAETFMDEAFATYLTHRWLDRKLGHNNKMLKWPHRLDWLPNIYRENYRYSSYVGHVRRGESVPAIQNLSEMGDVITLFSAAYDRGSKVLGMLESRLGPAAFMEFLRLLQRKYCFKVLHAKTFQAELEAFTGRDFDDFFAKWVYGAGLADWAVKSVRVKPTRPLTGGGPYRTLVRLKQKAQLTEPTVLGVSFGGEEGYPMRVPVVPAGGEARFDDPPAVVRRTADDEWLVELMTPQPPTQVSVDPDNVLIDADQANNHWRDKFRVRMTPFMTQLDETDLTTEYDRWNVLFGPWFYGGTGMNFDPWYSRSTMLGLRAGLYRTQKFTGGVFAAYRSDYRDVVAGVDALIHHWPFPKTQLGFHYEERIADPIGTDAPSRATLASAFARYVFQYNSSLYLPPIKYIEAFGTYQDNLLPFTRTRTPGAKRPDHYALAGVHYRINYLTPYWHPEFGFRLDLTYAGGAVDFDESEFFNSFQADFSYAQRLPDGLGRLSETVLAAHVAAGAAWPDEGEFFALGGSTRFRGYDLAERQGSLYWAASLEARFPLLRDADLDALDHVARLKNLYLAAFYDVGRVYADGNGVGDVAHAIGAGLRIDLAWFSVIERATVRLDAAKTVNDATPWQFWVGIQHPF